MGDQHTTRHDMFDKVWDAVISKHEAIVAAQDDGQKFDKKWDKVIAKHNSMMKGKDGTMSGSAGDSSEEEEVSVGKDGDLRPFIVSTTSVRRANRAAAMINDPLASRAPDYRHPSCHHHSRSIGCWQQQQQQQQERPGVLPPQLLTTIKARLFGFVVSLAEAIHGIEAAPLGAGNDPEPATSNQRPRQDITFAETGESQPTDHPHCLPGAKWRGEPMLWLGVVICMELIQTSLSASGKCILGPGGAASTLQAPLRLSMPQMLCILLAMHAISPAIPGHRKLPADSHDALGVAFATT